MTASFVSSCTQTPLRHFLSRCTHVCCLCRLQCLSFSFLALCVEGVGVVALGQVNTLEANTIITGVGVSVGGVSVHLALDARTPACRLLSLDHTPPPPSLCACVQLMHILLGAICVMFGTLWFRAMARVRANVGERALLSRRIAALLSSLETDTKELVLDQVVVLQAAVRRRQAMILAQRLHAMNA